MTNNIWLIHLVLFCQSKTMYSQIETISEEYSLTRLECQAKASLKSLWSAEVAQMVEHTFLP